eukprot:TRINITY_DN4165_c0_g1_i1.p1 TRINITY_DN4165_c0_g1~~TRINITY_DN4165_c0_g1_i1.p1  ORF type:complete len:406 (-),score=97.05 TRINITY_DN4165_c0_g1_i1:27-1244(-)
MTWPYLVLLGLLLLGILAITNSNRSLRLHCVKLCAKKISGNIELPPIDDFLDYFFERLAFTGKYTGVDFFGSLLAHRLLDKPINSTGVFSDVLLPGPSKRAFPIFTCIRPETGESSGGATEDIHADNPIVGQNVEWYEITPFEFGSPQTNSYVPVWCVGQPFFNGKSVKILPEPQLTFWMGVCGSAFETTFRENHLEDLLKIKNPLIQQLGKFFLNKTEIGQIRHFLTPMQIRNYEYALSGAQARRRQAITLADSGLDMNIPIAPLLRPDRQLDIIIVFDYSSKVSNAIELLRTESYAKRVGRPFPKISEYFKETTVESASMHVIKSAEKGVPWILYFPRSSNQRYDPNYDVEKEISDKSKLAYDNFVYSNETFDKFSGLMEFAVKENKDRVVQVIREYLEFVAM